MSTLPYPEHAAVTVNATAEMQIWNNAAFDTGESEDSTAAKASWWSESKENLNPDSEKFPISPRPREEKAKNRDERVIDMEIEEIENEIRRLSTRLEDLMLEKAEKQLISKEIMERRGRIVFTEHHHPAPFPSSGTKPKIVSRRGFSLGPAEIASKARLLTKLETAAAAAAMTPISSTANRRKSCFWKLGEIDELKVTKERGKSQSVSPKSRCTDTKPHLMPSAKQAQTTVGSKRPVKREDGAILSLIQPKNLFNDGEKSFFSTKTKQGRIVASRYSQVSTEDRKRSLPESGEDDGNKRRASRGNGNNNTNQKVKKKWEIPRELILFKGREDHEGEDPSSLPNIRTERRPRPTAETPRDSGAAKRVAELVGKKSFFAVDEADFPVEEGSVCLALSFEE